LLKEQVKRKKQIFQENCRIHYLNTIQPELQSKWSSPAYIGSVLLPI